MSKSVVLGGANDALPTAATEYLILQGGGDAAWNGTITNESQLIPVAGTLSRLFIKVQTAPGAGKSWAFTLYVNGSATALTLTIADAATTGSDITNSVSVSAGDRISLECVATGGTASSRAHIGVEFNGTTAKQSPFMGSNQGTTNNSSARAYCPVGTCAAGEASASDAEQVISAAGTLKNLYVRTDPASGTGNGLTYTVVKNGVDTALAVTIMDPAQTGNNTTDEVAVSPGDRIYIRRDRLDSSITSVASEWGIGFVADTDGQFNVMHSNNDPLNAASTEYNYGCAGTGLWSTTEIDRDSGATAFTVQAIYGYLGDGAPGAGKSYTITFRQNAGATGQSFAITDAAVSNNDTTPDVAISDNDLIGWESAPSGTPTVRMITLGARGFIDPGGGGSIQPPRSMHQYRQRRVLV